MERQPRQQHYRLCSGCSQRCVALVVSLTDAFHSPGSPAALEKIGWKRLYALERRFLWQQRQKNMCSYSFQLEMKLTITHGDQHDPAPGHRQTTPHSSSAGLNTSTATCPSPNASGLPVVSPKIRMATSRCRPSRSSAKVFWVSLLLSECCVQALINMQTPTR